MGKGNQKSNLQDQVFIWLASTTTKERFDFLRKAIDSVPLEEIKGVQRLTENARKRKKTFQQDEENHHEKKRFRRDVPVCPGSPVSSPQNDVKPWWTKYKDCDVVGLDTEMVSLNQLSGKKHDVKAASVAIVRLSDKKVLYYSKIYHKTGSFVVNRETLKVNGFKADSLEDGKDFHLVKKHVEEILGGKLVITVAGAGDFKALDISMNNYDVFDLHQHWKKWNGTITKAGVPVFQPISLKSLYWHYKGKKVQQGIHDPVIDCNCTLELFNVYKTIKKTQVDSRESIHHVDNFQNIMKPP